VQIADFDSTDASFAAVTICRRRTTTSQEPAEGNLSIQRDCFHAQNTYAPSKNAGTIEFAPAGVPWIQHAPARRAARDGGSHRLLSPEAEVGLGYFTGFSGERVHVPIARHRRARRRTRCLTRCASATRIRRILIAAFTGFPEIALLSVFAQPEVVEHLLLGDGRAART
jgi:hypothetical protein